MSSKDLVQFVQAEFRAKADARKAKEMAAYMKTDMPFYGVQNPQRIPVYSQFKKQFAPENRSEYERRILALWNLPHREEKYAALEYACQFDLFIGAETVPLFERLVREGGWWDFVDVIAIELLGHALRKDRSVVAAAVETWIEDSDMWIRRSALLVHNHHKSETDAKQLFDHCRRLCHEKEFFIRKAIGWALREYSYTEPERVKRFLLTNRRRLSPLSFREGSKRLIKIGWAPDQ